MRRQMFGMTFLVSTKVHGVYPFLLSYGKDFFFFKSFSWGDKLFWESFFWGVALHKELMIRSCLRGRVSQMPFPVI